MAATIICERCGAPFEMGTSARASQCPKCAGPAHDTTASQWHAQLVSSEGPTFGLRNYALIGSRHDCNIRLGDTAVMEEHAAIEMLDEGYVIRAASQGAVFYVNGRQVRRARLEHGDRITIGRTLLRFQTRFGGTPDAPMRPVG